MQQQVEINRDDIDLRSLPLQVSSELERAILERIDILEGAEHGNEGKGRISGTENHDRMVQGSLGGCSGPCFYMKA